MLLIPVIEIKNGKCTLPQVPETFDPARAARHWLEAGARRLHLLDRDAAASGKPANVGAVRTIVETCAGVPVQVGGGLRSEAAVEAYFEAGASYAVLGSKALSTPHVVNNLCLEYPGRIFVGLEARDGKLLADGWSKFAEHDVAAAAAHFQREGAAGIVCTHDGGEGRLDGADRQTLLTVAQSVAIPVFVAGGIGSLPELRALAKDGGEALGGAILSGAHAGTLDFAKAQQLADGLSATPKSAGRGIKSPATE